MNSYNIAEVSYGKLEEALTNFVKKLSVGTSVRHPKFGSGKVTAIDTGYVTVAFDNGEERPLGLTVVIGNHILKADYDGYADDIAKYAEVIAKSNSIKPHLILLRMNWQSMRNILMNH